MNYQRIEQKSPEWWKLKVGKVSGTRFGQLISNRENSLVEEIVNELLDGCCDQDDYESEEMTFGNENEPIAIDLYSQMIGVEFERGGVILSDFSDYHMASPDAINLEKGIVVEVKSTMNGKTQIKRFFNGIDSQYKPQAINYFACSDDVKEVHWISYCPFRQERPIIAIVLTRDSIIYPEKYPKKSKSIRLVVEEGRTKLKALEQDIISAKKAFETIDF